MQESQAQIPDRRRLVLDPATLVAAVLLLVVAAVAWMSLLKAGDMPGMGMAQGGSSGGGDMPGERSMDKMDTPAGMTSGERSMDETATPAEETSDDMPGERAMGPGVLAGALPFLAAWGVMMAAMMLPSATPMLALVGGIHRNSGRKPSPAVASFLFTAVYVAVWLAIGIPVYLAGRGLEAVSRSNPGLANALPYALAATLVACGLFQLTPLKRACLKVCQHPLTFLFGHWREGFRGTLNTAFKHAAYCVGCCWALMAVLIVAGAMSLPWVLLIAALILAEKLFPKGQWIAGAIGVGFIFMGLAVAVNPDLAAVVRGTMSWGM